jgi:hypothetical protein
MPELTRITRDPTVMGAHPATIGELKWYFEHRDKATREGVHPQTMAFLNVGARVFGAPRFTEMYRRWLKHGDAVFEGPSSPVIAEGAEHWRRPGRVVRPAPYLSPSLPRGRPSAFEDRRR